MREVTVLDLFRNAVSSGPEANALVEGDRAITYRQLDEFSDRVADQLRLGGVAAGAVVPLITSRSAAVVVAMVGVLKCGGTYVPVDEANPVVRIRRILQQCGSSTVIRSASGAESTRGVEVCDAVDVAGAEGADEFEGEDLLPVSAAGQAPVYVVFTSGTTGMPKGVVVQHSSLTHLVTWHNRRFDMDRSTRTTLMCGVGFDVMQWEVWSTLAAGGCLHVPDEATRVNPTALLQYFAVHRITHTYVPTIMVREVAATPAPPGLKLRFLFCAGEKMPPVPTAHLPYTLVDYYGPTEATIFATYRVLPTGSENQPPSIGNPIDGTEAFVLNADLSEVADGATGELCLAGRGLALGYLSDPVLTEQRFVWSPRLSRRLYRTGDLARRLPDGSLQFLGREDDQVKIRGYRIELGDVEATLLGNRLVKHAVVLLDEDENTPGSKRLAAWVVPHDGNIDPDRLVATLRAHARLELPDYMLPGIYQCLPALPVLASGKIDRKALRAAVAAEHARPVASDAFADNVERAIADAWRTALGHSRFTATDSFFDVGGHSMLTTSLVEDISTRLDVHTYIWDFYGAPTIRGLAEDLRERRGQQPLDWEGEPVRELHGDIYLPPGITAVSGRCLPQQFTNPEHILLTGTTGVVGAHLLERLLVSTDAQIHCPVRSRETSLAEERLRQVVSRYELDIDDTAWKRVVVYAADLAEPHFGLTDTDYDTLARTVDVVYHSASAANFIEPYSYMRRDNVQGLREVIGFAFAEHLKPLMLVSSISVYSWGHLFTGKTMMYEHDDIDQNLQAIATDLGYMRCKWVMEKVAQLAAARGLPVMTFRLGYATCNSRTGHSANYQWWPRLVRTCIALKAVPDLRNLREGLTTVDYIADAITAISRQPDAVGKNFNIIPTPSHIVTLQKFFQLLTEHFGYEFTILPFRQWVELWENDPCAPLYPLLNMFKDKVLDGKSTIELYQETYLWDCENVLHHLDGTGIREPEFTKEILARYLDHVLVEPYIPLETPRPSGTLGGAQPLAAAADNPAPTSSKKI